MDIIEFKIAFPPSVNCLYAGKDTRHKSDAYEAWLRMARPFFDQFRANNPNFSTVEYAVGAWYRHGDHNDKTVRDVENYSKAISDMLKHEKILKDDSLIRRTAAEWVDDIPQGYTEVILVPVDRLIVSIEP